MYKKNADFLLYYHIHLRSVSWLPSCVCTCKHSCGCRLFSAHLLFLSRPLLFLFLLPSLWLETLLCPRHTTGHILYVIIAATFSCRKQHEETAAAEAASFFRKGQRTSPREPQHQHIVRLSTPKTRGAQEVR